MFQYLDWLLETQHLQASHKLFPPGNKGEKIFFFLPLLVRQEFGQPMTPNRSLQVHCNENWSWGVARQAHSKQLAINFQSNIRNTFNQTIFSFIDNFQCVVAKNTSIVPHSCEKTLLRHLTNQSRNKIIMTKIC